MAGDAVGLARHHPRVAPTASGPVLANASPVSARVDNPDDGGLRTYAVRPIRHSASSVNTAARRLLICDASTVVTPTVIDGTVMVDFPAKPSAALTAVYNRGNGNVDCHIHTGRIVERRRVHGDAGS